MSSHVYVIELSLLNQKSEYSCVCVRDIVTKSGMRLVMCMCFEVLLQSQESE